MQKTPRNRMERTSFPGQNKKPGSGTDKRGYAPSIHKGEDFTVTIEELGHNGDGIVHIEGYTVFVKNTEVGEEVTIKIKEVRETIAFAERLA